MWSWSCTGSVEATALDTQVNSRSLPFAVVQMARTLRVARPRADWRGKSRAVGVNGIVEFETEMRITRLYKYHG